MAIVIWDKKRGETLSDTLDRFRLENIEYAHEKITYAGRLDPMAEGLLPLLTGGDIYKKDSYLGMDKVYEVDFFFGPVTDSLDVLGCVDMLRSCAPREVDVDAGFLVGEHFQEYPRYSSKTVNGKPLWKWEREGLIDTIVIPSRKIQVYSVDMLPHTQISLSDLQEQICNDICLVNGDFRQERSLSLWRDYFMSYDANASLVLYRMRVHVSSGTYVRSLVQELSRFYGLPATTYAIRRIRVGDMCL